MIPGIESVILARWQFGFVASFHFLFVPLTLGLTWMLLAMEIAYVKTGNPIYKDMTRFWGKLFGINFALGVLTGLTMEFQFGTNWAYYSQFVGDIFGTPLAIEGLAAFMLESTFLGLFFFGWDKLSKGQHLFATFCLAIGSSLSALLILVANGFMQHPVGAEFNYQTMHMQTTSLLALFENGFAQIGFAHVILAGFTTGAVFVLGVSSYYLLKKRDVEFAKRSFAIAAGFGLVASMMVMVIGDQNGLIVFKQEPEKLAIIEAEWETSPPPAAFNLIAFPNQAEQKNNFAIQIPYLLGPLVSHSFSTSVQGIKDFIKENEAKIQQGDLAYQALLKMRQGDTSPAVMNQYHLYKDNLGYGLLLLNYAKDMHHPTQAEIQQAATDTIPDVASIFWTFRIMVALGLLMGLMFFLAFIGVLCNKIWDKNWFYRWAIISIPFPFIASICGWFVTEHGRQPWSVTGILPTPISASSLSATDVMISLAIFGSLYFMLFIIEMFLMLKFGRKGPSALHTGQYHFETQGKGKH